MEITYEEKHSLEVQVHKGGSLCENRGKQKQKTKLPKRVHLTKTKLKAMLEYERVKETTKRVSKMRENSPNL